MRIIPRNADDATFNAHKMTRVVATSPAMGRPKIEGLVKFNLQLMADQKAALEKLVESERVRRGDPGLTLTDVMREALAEYLARHAKRGRGTAP